MIPTSVDLVTHPRTGFQLSDDALNRLERLLTQTLLYLKDQCTDANLSDAWGEYLLRTRRKEGVYKIDVMTEVLSDKEWLITPDISNQIFSVLKLIYSDAAQPIFDLLWAEAYKRDIVSSAVAPGIEIELPIDDILNRSKKICDGIDRGTIAYLAKLLLDGDGKDLETIRYLMFDSGGNDEDTLADMRIRNIVNTETCWARNLCNLNMLSKLRLENKEWVKGTKQCKIALTNELIGSVSLDHEYVSNYGESVMAPPGCVGCDCRISSSFDQDLSILRELDSDTSNRSLGSVDGSGIVCIEPPDELRTLLGVKSPHITIVYLGKNGSSFWNLVELAVKKVCKEFAPFSLYLTGEMRTLGVPNRGDVDVALVCNSKELRRLKDALEDELKNMYVVEFSEWREWIPHITIGDAHTVSDDMIEDFGDPWVVDSLCIWVGNKSERFELEAREKIQPVDEEEDMIDRFEEKAIRYGFKYSKSLAFDSASSIQFDSNESRYVYVGETPAMVKAFLDGPDQRPLDAVRWLMKNNYRVVANDTIQASKPQRRVEEKSEQETRRDGSFDRAEFRELVREIVKSSYEEARGQDRRDNTRMPAIHMPDVHMPEITVKANLTLPDEFKTVVENVINVPKQDQPKIIVSAPNVTVESPIVKNEITVPETKVVVQAQPAPIVNVSAAKIFVDVPETKVDVHVPKSVININVPEQPAPIIKQTIAIPKQDPIVVNVEVNPELKAELTMPDSEEEEATEVIRNKDKEIVGTKKKIKRTYKKK